MIKWEFINVGEKTWEQFRCKNLLYFVLISPEKTLRCWSTHFKVQKFKNFFLHLHHLQITAKPSSTFIVTNAYQTLKRKKKISAENKSKLSSWLPRRCREMKLRIDDKLKTKSQVGLVGLFNELFFVFFW